MYIYSVVPAFKNSTISSVNRAAMGFVRTEKERGPKAVNKRYWRGPGRARWELRPRAHPTAIYGSRLPFLREHSVTLRKPRRRLDEDEIGRVNEDDSR